MEDDLPNYLTKWEREHPYLSAVSKEGFSNFWFDKIFYCDTFRSFIDFLFSTIFIADFFSYFFTINFLI